MNPSIQWEEDWFTITPSDQEQEQPKQQEQEQPNQQEQEQPNQQEQPNHQEQIQDLYHRLEQLSLLVQAQSEQITLLQRELREQQPHTAASDIAALLEELKRVKERELNLALRRHQPVPFFDSGMLQRIVPYHNLFRTTATKL